MPRPNAVQVSRAGEPCVVAEIQAAYFGSNMPKIDVLASERDQVHKVTIQVKAAQQTSAISRQNRRNFGLENENRWTDLRAVLISTDPIAARPGLEPGTYGFKVRFGPTVANDGKRRQTLERPVFAGLQALSPDPPRSP